MLYAFFFLFFSFSFFLFSFSFFLFFLNVRWEVIQKKNLVEGLGVVVVVEVGAKKS